jgi:thymidylate synthase (FAD)
MHVELIACTPDPQRVIERAARICYQSEDRAGEQTAGELIRRLLQMGHASPLEHAYATFRLEGVSRAMSHQLVRHRLIAVSQKSQRYVSERAFGYVVPPSLPGADRLEFERDMDLLRGLYAKWKERGLRNEDARFVLPNACTTELMLSANFREWRHIISVRCTRHAQWEIREACRRIWEHLNTLAPAVFADLAAIAGGAAPEEPAS